MDASNFKPRVHTIIQHTLLAQMWLPDEMVDMCLSYLPLMDRVNISRRHRKESKELAAVAIRSAVHRWQRWIQTRSDCCGVSPRVLRIVSSANVMGSNAGDIGQGWCVDCVKRFYPIEWRPPVQTTLTQAIVAYRMEPMIHAATTLVVRCMIHALDLTCHRHKHTDSSSLCPLSMVDVIREFVREFFERDGLDASAAARLQLVCNQLPGDVHAMHGCIAVDEVVNMIRSKILSIMSKWQWADLITFATTTSRFYLEFEADSADANTVDAIRENVNPADAIIDLAVDYLET